MALLGLAVGGFLGARALMGRAGDDSVAVHLVEATDPGPDPFTSDHTLVSDAGRSTARDAGGRLGAFAVESASHGDLGVRNLTPAGHGALYGSAEEVCDTDAMVSSLDADPDARAVWAELMAVEVTEVESTLASLSPLVLTRDTAVTNSSYSNGEGRRFQAVLEAGTAVLVDAAGAPRVRCSCTNPLGEPELPKRVTLEGEPWNDFDASSVIAVTGGETEGEGVLEIPVVDLPTGEETTIRLDAGDGTVQLDGYLVDDAEGVHVVAEDGERTRILDHPVAKVFDDGEGGLIYQHERSAGIEDYERRGTAFFPPADPLEANIWHLPAGKSEPVALLSVEDPLEGWYSLQDVGETDRGTWLAFYRMSAGNHCGGSGGCDPSGPGTSGMFDLETGDTVDVPVSPIIATKLAVGGGVVIYGEVWDDHGGLHAMDLDMGHLPSACDIDCALSASDIFDDGRWVRSGWSDDRAVVLCPFSGPCEDVVDVGGIPSSSHVSDVHVVGEEVVVTYADDDSGLFAYVIDLSADIGSRQEPRRLETGGRTKILSSPLIRPSVPLEPADTTAPTTDAVTSTTTPERETISGLYVDGMSLEGLLPLRFGATLEEAEALTGLATEPICGFDSFDFGAVIELEGASLWFDDFGVFGFYNVYGSSPYTTPSGVGPASALRDARGEFTGLEGDGYEGLVLNGIPTRVVVGGLDGDLYFSVADEAVLEPGTGQC